MHPGNKQTGFTLIETSIAVGIASILAAIAVPQYNIHIAKTQLAESISLMDAAKPGAAAAIVKQGLCTADGKDLTFPGKYGALVVSGTVDSKAVKNSKVRMATGCIFTYTANTSGVSKLIAGKTVVTDLFNNGTFSKNAATTADEKLLPKALSLLDQDPAGSKITPTVPGGPNITNPGDNGGPSTPNTIPPVGPSNPDTSSPDPSNPDPAKPDPAAPTDPISGDPSNPEPPPLSETATYNLVIDAAYLNVNVMNSGYSLKPSVNIYDFFVAKVGTKPKATSNVVIRVNSDVALVGFANISFNSGDTAGMVIDNRWNAKSLTIENHGVIVGAGGAGSTYGKRGAVMTDGGNGQPGIINNSTIEVKVSNYGIVAGGGGGGGGAHKISYGAVGFGAGGGAPFGRMGWGTSGMARHGASAGFLNAGLGNIDTSQIVGCKGYRCLRPEVRAQYPFFQSGVGGEWGESGVAGVMGRVAQIRDPYAGNAGAIKIGNVVITNINTGKSLGN